MNLLTTIAAWVIFFGVLYAFITIASLVIMAAWSIFPLIFVGAVIFILIRAHHETKND
jgi:hypothetical protein